MVRRLPVQAPRRPSSLGCGIDFSWRVHVEAQVGERRQDGLWLAGVPGFERLHHYEAHRGVVLG